MKEELNHLVSERVNESNIVLICRTNFYEETEEREKGRKMREKSREKEERMENEGSVKTCDEGIHRRGNCIKNKVEGIKNGTECIKDRVEGIKNGTECIKDKVEGIKNGTECIKDRVECIKNGRSMKNQTCTRIDESIKMETRCESIRNGVGCIKNVSRTCIESCSDGKMFSAYSSSSNPSHHEVREKEEEMREKKEKMREKGEREKDDVMRTTPDFYTSSSSSSSSLDCIKSIKNDGKNCIKKFRPFDHNHSEHSLYSEYSRKYSSMLELEEERERTVLRTINNTNHNNNLSKIFDENISSSPCPPFSLLEEEEKEKEKEEKEKVSMLMFRPLRRKFYESDNNENVAKRRRVEGRKIDEGKERKSEERRKGRNLNVLFFMTIITMQLIGLVNCYNPSSSDPCRFPPEWIGRWFQKGIPESISITSNEMSEKGVCKETVGDKFLIESSTERCVRCIVMSQKHSNVIQYKETFCYPITRNLHLRDVCSEINGDANLYSLFRLDTPTIPCPFNGGNFVFSYSRGHGECNEPMSTIESCIDTTRLLFRFQACADVIGSESRNEQLDCYAEWKEGSTRYLVGKMSHRITRNDEDKFRCFVFEKIGQSSNSDMEEAAAPLVDTSHTSGQTYGGATVYGANGYLLAQSGDATCDGLSSVYEGSRTMKLIHSNPLLPTCNFPNEIIISKYWKYLDQIYDFSKNSTVRIYNSTTAEILRTITCIKQEETRFRDDDHTSIDDSSYTEFVVHSVSGCDIGFMCLRIHKRENQVVEIEESSLSRGPIDSLGACSYQRFNKNYLTLFVIRQSSSSSISSDADGGERGRDDPSSSSNSLDHPALHSNPSLSSSTISSSSFSSLLLLFFILFWQR